MLAAFVGAMVYAAAPASVPRDELDAVARYRRAHRRTQLAGMSVLTGWAVANIASGIAGAVVVEDDRRFVHEMNAMWNSVNLTLGIVGLVTNARRRSAITTTGDAARVYRRALRVYAVNGALDVFYIAAGVLTAELGRVHDTPRAEGYGKSVVLQGAWLLAFDLAMLVAHEHAARRLPALGLVPGGRGLALVARGSF